jgi:hypothetical protein
LHSPNQTDRKPRLRPCLISFFDLGFVFSGKVPSICNHESGKIPLPHFAAPPPTSPPPLHNRKAPNCAPTMPWTRVVPVFEDDIVDYEQIYHADTLSPGNDMIVDSEDLLNDAEAEKDDADIAIINPEDEPAYRADDCESSAIPGLYHWLTCSVVEGMKELVLPDLQEQPPILETQVHNWAIENWRDHPRRDHGPIFEAGGHPWYTISRIVEKLGG